MDPYHPEENNRNNPGRSHGWNQFLAHNIPSQYDWALFVLQSAHLHGAGTLCYGPLMLHPSNYPSLHHSWNTQASSPIEPNHTPIQVLPLSTMKDKDAHKAFFRLILSYDELVSNGFVYIDNLTRRIDVHAIKQQWNNWCAPGDPTRVCVRCSAVFSVHFPDGVCRYHVQKRGCCGQVAPCAVATTHVHNISDRNELLHFVKTPKESHRSRRNGGDGRSKKVYALDTEMIYTTKGLEVARVTLVDARKKTVADVFVKPKERITDLNTQFSGIQEGYLAGANTLEEVRGKLLKHINENTILIGHHISNDLRVLKIVHDRVVDTAVLFKRDNGTFPQLRELAQKYLNKTIHEEVEGHDSAQDARTCIELVSQCWHQLIAHHQAV